MGWGFVLLDSGTRITHMNLEDNIILVGTRVEQMGHMLYELDQQLFVLNFTLKRASLEFVVSP